MYWFLNKSGWTNPYQVSCSNLVQTHPMQTLQTRIANDICLIYILTQIAFSNVPLTPAHHRTQPTRSCLCHYTGSLKYSQAPHQVYVKVLIVIIRLWPLLNRHMFLLWALLLFLTCSFISVDCKVMKQTVLTFLLYLKMSSQYIR